MSSPPPNLEANNSQANASAATNIPVNQAVMGNQGKPGSQIHVATPTHPPTPRPCASSAPTSNTMLYASSISENSPTVIQVSGATARSFLGQTRLPLVCQVSSPAPKTTSHAFNSISEQPIQLLLNATPISQGVTYVSTLQDQGAIYVAASSVSRSDDSSAASKQEVRVITMPVSNEGTAQIFVRKPGQSVPISSTCTVGRAHRPTSSVKIIGIAPTASTPESTTTTVNREIKVIYPSWPLDTPPANAARPRSKPAAVQPIRQQRRRRQMLKNRVEVPQMYAHHHESVDPDSSAEGFRCIGCGVVLATAEALSEHGRLAGKRSVCNAERPICRARHAHNLISMQFDTKEAALQHFFDLQLDTALVRRSSCKRLPYVFFECRKADRKVKGKRKDVEAEDLCPAKLSITTTRYVNTATGGFVPAFVLSGCLSHNHQPDQRHLRVTLRRKQEIQQLLASGTPFDQICNERLRPMPELAAAQGEKLIGYKVAYNLAKTMGIAGSKKEDTSPELYPMMLSASTTENLRQQRETRTKMRRAEWLAELRRRKIAMQEQDRQDRQHFAQRKEAALAWLAELSAHLQQADYSRQSMSLIQSVEAISLPQLPTEEEQRAARASERQERKRKRDAAPTRAKETAVVVQIN